MAKDPTSKDDAAAEQAKREADAAAQATADEQQRQKQAREAREQQLRDQQQADKEANEQHARDFELDAKRRQAAETERSNALHDMEHIDQVLRSLGHGMKDRSGSGIAAAVRHVAAMMGVPTDAFLLPPDDKAKAA